MSDPGKDTPHRLSVRLKRLGDPDSSDLSAVTTVSERLEMVQVLSARMWELTGRPWPSYRREEIPVVVRRR